MKDKLKMLSPSNLIATVNGYGFNYSMSKFLLTVILVLAGMVLTGWLLKLKFLAVIAVAIFAFLMVPVIIAAQFRFMHNNAEFGQLVNYLDQMIISFKTTPKILVALYSTVDMVEGEMKKIVKEAIRIIETDTTSKNVYEKAFQHIENKYHCTRLKTLHKFLLNVEKNNSRDYQKSLDTLYFDVREWVQRTYDFQRGLATQKRNVTIILLISLGFVGFFTYILHTVEDAMQNTGTDGTFEIFGSLIYQGDTILILVLFILIYTTMCSKFTGDWFVNDISEDEDKLVLLKMKKYNEFDKAAALIKGIISGLMFGGVFAVLGFVMQLLFQFEWAWVIYLVAGLFAILMIFWPFLQNSNRKKAIERELTKEFPIWMRDIAINLNNMVVVRAVAESIDGAGVVLQPFLKRFLRRIEENPASIKPYTEFLGKYEVSELSTAIRTLYAIRILSAEDSQRQINDLVQRNQALMAKSEQIRQEDKVGAVGFISLLPMLLMSLKLMIDMFIMLIQFFSMIGGAA